MVRRDTVNQGAGKLDAAAFRSILFPPAMADRPCPETPPDCFADLNLDQLVADIAARAPEHALEAFFNAPLPDNDAIEYRHEIFRDLETSELQSPITAFSQQMRTMRARLVRSHGAGHRLVGQCWFVDAIACYCDAVAELTRELKNCTPQSRGLQALRDYLAGYVDSRPFSELTEQVDQRQAGLRHIEYEILIRGNNVTVSRYQDEADYRDRMLEAFARFRQEPAGSARHVPEKQSRLNQIEVNILDRVARLYPRVSAALDTFGTRHADYLDDTVARFDREIHFYLAYRRIMTRLQSAGMYFCYPRMVGREQTIHADGAFDIALAQKRGVRGTPVVSNDFRLEPPERVIVVSGPNQGGKTTFARTVGQLHYLARLGCPVPGHAAQLLFYDRLFTHFERAEDVRSLRGKLEDDLLRIHAIFENASADSVVIMNEIFSSATTRDALYLGDRILRQLIELRALGVCVTFIDELASLTENVVSMVSTVAPDDPSVRTFKVVRRPADGLAYARTLAEKHGLTRTALDKRL